MNNTKANKLCPICAKAMKNKICNWSYYCDSCNYWAADLQPNINSQNDHIFSEERNDSDIISFLDSIRINNFNKILDKAIQETDKKILNILDVGCASGLFMRTAEERGHIVTGIEPNSIMAKTASDKGLNVINGFFPAAVKPVSKFDVIIFNDVFEHIPDLDEILTSSKIFLSGNGILVLNLPNSDGILFRVAKMLAVVGVLGPWNRLWQVMFYTPHVHYFNSYSLDKLLNKYDFINSSGSIEIEALSLTGLWNRLSIDKSSTLLTRVLLYVGIILFYPITKYLEKDAFYATYKMNTSSNSHMDR